MNISKEKLKKTITNFFIKTLIVAIITLTLLISMKKSISFKAKFYKHVYDTNFSFDKFKNIYNKYFRDLKINDKKDEKVSVTKFSYTSINKYLDGAKLSVSNDYPVTVQNDGIIVFLGKKEGYGKTVIVQQSNGIDMWYGNLENVSYSVYDYVTKGDILGNCNQELYVLFKKNGEILDYEKYL